MRLADFQYDLPEDRIAQTPTVQRDESRLMVLDRKSRTWRHRQFCDLPEYLHPGDLLVRNNSKVIPARWRGHRKGGGPIEILLLREEQRLRWWAMLKPGKRAPVGSHLVFVGQGLEVDAEVLEKNADGHALLEFHGTSDVLGVASVLGEIPLPPYISRNPGPSLPTDRERYQTVYATMPGSVAAPTAGLHFTPELLARLAAMGVRSADVTLHVGAGTFAPVKTDDLNLHAMHSECFQVSRDALEQLRRTRASGGRIVAVGTTSCRTLETLGPDNRPGTDSVSSDTRLFLRPPATFQSVDVLLTNFHLPGSTLLMLVSAFADPGGLGGREWILAAYQEAIREGYRFFSYGDAMLIV